MTEGIALGYDGHRLSGVLNRLIPPGKGVVGQNIWNLGTKCPKSARCFVVSLAEQKSHINRKGKHEHIREETGSKHRVV